MGMDIRINSVDNDLLYHGCFSEGVWGSVQSYERRFDYPSSAVRICLLASCSGVVIMLPSISQRLILFQKENSWMFVAQTLSYKLGVSHLITRFGRRFVAGLTVAGIKSRIESYLYSLPVDQNGQSEGVYNEVLGSIPIGYLWNTIQLCVQLKEPNYLAVRDLSAGSNSCRDTVNVCLLHHLLQQYDGVSFHVFWRFGHCASWSELKNSAQIAADTADIELIDNFGSQRYDGLVYATKYAMRLVMPDGAIAYFYIKSLLDLYNCCQRVGKIGCEIRPLFADSRRVQNLRFSLVMRLFSVYEYDVQEKLVSPRKCRYCKKLNFFYKTESRSYLECDPLRLKRYNCSCSDGYKLINSVILAIPTEAIKCKGLLVEGILKGKFAVSPAQMQYDMQRGNRLTVSPSLNRTRASVIVGAMLSPIALCSTPMASASSLFSFDESNYQCHVKSAVQGVRSQGFWKLDAQLVERYMRYFMYNTMHQGFLNSFVHSIILMHLDELGWDLDRMAAEGVYFNRTVLGDACVNDRQEITEVFLDEFHYMGRHALRLSFLNVGKLQFKEADSNGDDVNECVANLFVCTQGAFLLDQSFFATAIHQAKRGWISSEIDYQKGLQAAVKKMSNDDICCTATFWVDNHM